MDEELLDQLGTSENVVFRREKGSIIQGLGLRVL